METKSKIAASSLILIPPVQEHIQLQRQPITILPRMQLKLILALVAACTAVAAVPVENSVRGKTALLFSLCTIDVGVMLIHLISDLNLASTVSTVVSREVQNRGGGDNGNGGGGGDGDDDGDDGDDDDDGDDGDDGDDSDDGDSDDDLL